MDDIFVFYKICKLLVAGKSKNHAWFVKRARKQSTMKVFLKINYFVRISWLRIQIHVLLWYSWTPHWATVPINKNACVIVLLHWFENKKYKQPSPNCSKFWNFRYTYFTLIKTNSLWYGGCFHLNIYEYLSS